MNDLYVRDLGDFTFCTSWRNPEMYSSKSWFTITSCTWLPIWYYRAILENTFLILNFPLSTQDSKLGELTCSLTVCNWISHRKMRG